MTSMYVAGMRPATQYHMQAVVLAPDGSTFADGDHLFTTAALPTGYQPNFSIETPSGLPPQPGIELMNALQGALQAFATDLSGTVVWYYPEASFSVQPIKLLPNGHLAVLISPGTPTPVGTPEPAGAIDTIREIDLVGNTIRELSLSDLNNKLAAGGYTFTAFAYHHEITALPNGHWLTFVAIQKQFTDLPGYPGTILVQGDVVIDLDQSFNPVWVWNEFDHLDVNRHPFQFPDWTHSNAIIYSKDDGNILVSLRHQNWLIKVDYNNGQGTGDIIWKLGYEGDFTLLGVTDPTDWFYAQHGPSFFSASTTGNFILGLFDNGDDRVFPANVSCGAPGAPPCNYSTVPILQIDESAKTATIVSKYGSSVLGGNTDQPPNSNIHFCESGTATGAAMTADIFEVTQSSTPQIVWHLHSPTAYIYRSYRLGSLYPGVQW